jgi:hypothetical protein
MDIGDGIRGDMVGILCRNFLAFIRIKFRIQNFRLFLCRVDRRGNVTRCSESSNAFFSRISCKARTKISGDGTIPEGWNASGWQLNRRGHPGPRTTDLRSIMDPQKLAYESVFLNLSLMKWRAMPSVDIEQHRDKHCLLLGAGTYGST